MAAASASVVPGETRNCAPAARASFAWCGATTVPAPTRISGTSAAIRSIASNATGVRSVSSMTGTPPSTKAFATGTACSTSCTTTTGMTGTRSSNDSLMVLVLSSRSGDREDAGALVGRSDGCPEAAEQLPAGADPRVLVGGADGLALVELGLGHVHFEHAGVGVEREQVAVAYLRQPAAHRGLGGEVDRRRDLAGGARHPPVGDQRDAVAAVLEHAERGRQLVQLRHPVGGRALEAEHGDHVPVELALGECLQEVRLVVEHPRGCLDLTVLRLHGRDLDDAAAEVAVEHPQPAVGGEGLVDAAQHVGVEAPLRTLLPCHAGAVELGLGGVPPQAVSCRGAYVVVQEARL